MPYPKTETARLAESYGITYACAKYRLAQGIPLDAPAMPNNNPKGARVWDDQGRTMADIERATGLSRNSIKYRLERGIPLDAPKLSRAEARDRATEARLEKCERGEFVRRGLLERLDEFENVVVASDLCRVRNPFALLAGKRSATTASPTTPTTSAKSLSTASSGTSGGVSIPARTYARGGL